MTLGAKTYNNHGMASVQGMERMALTVDNFFFSPTFLQGAPGQKVRLQITNASGTMHNITMQSTPPIDTDIPAHGKVTVDATIPQSGVMQFYCEYHTGQGMNGQMLAAPATPQPASQGNPQPTKDPYYG
jgi:plastocyanin